MEPFGGAHSHLFDVGALKDSGAVPAWFGLGFIQVKLDAGSRLHFWHPDLFADVPEEELHDHRYRFRSRVLVGEIVHEEWHFEEAPDGDHELVRVSCKPGVKADPSPVARGRVKKGSVYTMRAGSEYEFSEDGFHRIRATRAVTYLTRGPVTKDLATVIKPVQTGSVCPFERKIPVEDLWGYIEDLLADGRRGYHLRDIPRGDYGTARKVLEEAHEFVDAVEQGSDVMALVELSDLYGAVRGWLARHPTITEADLERFSLITERAFRNGHR